MAVLVTMKTVECIVLLFLTLAYLPLHFFATQPPAHRVETVVQTQSEPNSEESPQQLSSGWSKLLGGNPENPKPKQVASSKWGTVPNTYCKKTGADTVPIILPDDYGFKPASAGRCREECAKRPECTSYTYGQWNKKPEIFGREIPWGWYYGQWRCQLYEMCEEHKPLSEWRAVVTLYKKPKSFIYTSSPPEHEFKVVSTLAISVVMAINIVYVFASTVGHQWGLLFIATASAVSAMDLRSYVDTASGIRIAALFLAYIFNCCMYMLMYSLEENDDNQRYAPAYSVGWSQPTVGLGMTLPPAKGESHAKFA